MIRILPVEHQDSCAIEPNLPDYDIALAGFRWDQIRRELNGLPEARGLNIAHEAVDRHADGPLRDRLAMRWLGSGGLVRDLRRQARKKYPIRWCDRALRLFDRRMENKL